MHWTAATAHFLSSTGGRAGAGTPGKVGAESGIETGDGARVQVVVVVVADHHEI